MFPGQGIGTNSGTGKLPFPNRPETILPENLVRDFETSVTLDGDRFVFTYAGSDGTLAYTWTPVTGTWSDVTARWRNGPVIRPLMGGGVRLDVDGRVAKPDRLEPLGTKLEGQAVVSAWRATVGGISTDVEYTFRLWNSDSVSEVLKMIHCKRF